MPVRQGLFVRGTNLLAAQVATVELGTAQFGGVTFDIYQLTASIPGFTATPGTEYWFAVLSHNPDEAAKLIWIGGTGAGALLLL